MINNIQIINNSTNCYLLPTKDGWLLVDTGLPDTFSQLLQLLSQNDISVYEINHLVITHFHPDHAGLTQNLRDLGTNLIVHEEQVPYMKELNAFYKKNPKANFKDIILNNAIVVSDDDSGSLLSSIGIDGKLISTPGHSDDSISLIIREDCAFTGDLPPYSLQDSYQDLVTWNSWDMICNNRVNQIYPGHGEPYLLDLV